MNMSARKNTVGFCGCAVLLAATSVWAADFTWLSAPASASWNTADANWTGAGAVWANASTNSAIFGASATQALTADATTVQHLTFNAGGYSIGGGPITFSGNITVASGQAATISAPLSHSASNQIFAKLGAGTLTVSPTGGSGTNWYGSLKAAAGTLHIAGGTNVVVLANSNPESGPALWATGGTLLMGGGLLKTTGGMYARVSDSGTLLITNGVVDLTGNPELLNAHNSPGVTTVSGTGELNVNTLRISQNTAASSTNLNVVNVNTGGLIRLNNFSIDAGSKKYGTVNFNGGTLWCKADGTDLFRPGSATATNWVGIYAFVREGGAIIDSNGKSVNIRQPLLSGAAQDGGFTKRSSGNVNLRGTNTYNGGTFLWAGSVNVESDSNLGAVPAAPTTNIAFLGNSTLMSGASHALAANRTVRIPTNVTAIFDTQSYTQTVYGAVGGEGTNSVLQKNGSGMLILDPGPTSGFRVGTLRCAGGVLACLSGTNLVTAANSGQNQPGLWISSGTLVVGGGYLKPTAPKYVNIDGGALLVTNGVADFSGMDEILNGIGASGRTTVSDTGLIIANSVRISQNGGNPSNAVVNVNTGGVLRLSIFYIDTGATQKGMLNLNGGTVMARIDTADFLGTMHERWLTNIFVNVLQGGAIFDSNGKNISIKQPLYSGAAGDGGFAKRGLGTVALLNTNTFTGAARVEAGALKLGVSNALSAASSVLVSTNAVADLGGFSLTLSGVGGSGLITNCALLRVTSFVAPGDVGSIGTLTLANSPVALSGAFTVDVATNGACDRLHVQGDLNLSELSLSLTDPAQLGSFHSYTIATCTGTLSGRFASVTLPKKWGVKYEPAAKRVFLFDCGTLISVR